MGGLEGGRSALWSHGAFTLMQSAPIGVDGFAYVAIRRGGWLARRGAAGVSGYAVRTRRRRRVQAAAPRVAIRRAWPGFARGSVLVRSTASTMIGRSQGRL